MLFLMARKVGGEITERVLKCPAAILFNTYTNDQAISEDSGSLIYAEDLPIRLQDKNFDSNLNTRKEDG